uniref:Putative secreted peptide n=1 Tax=Rhipicephalus pulchellus TaxID=72859 RepID=L7MCA1_RHIPC
MELLFGHLTLYVFVFLNTYTSYGIIIMPGNSTEDVVLVGYSVQYQQEGMTCIKSKYEGRDGEWVNRTLEYKDKSVKEGMQLDQEGTVHMSVKFSGYDPTLLVVKGLCPPPYSML